MKCLFAACLLAAAVLTAQAASAQSVQTQVISRYFGMDKPAVLNAPGVLRADANTVYLDVPGASLAGSDGSYYNRFVSFTLAMPKADWLDFLFN